MPYHAGKRQIIGACFFGFLTLVIISFQCYGYFSKNISFDFEMILGGVFCTVFCYFYQPDKSKSVPKQDAES